MNPFQSAWAADLYARSRPSAHALVVERIRAYLRLRAPLSFAADVGCGTGLSSRALAEIATEVVGIDPSEEMIARADLHPRVSYRVAPAEALPLADASCDLVTVASAFQLFDRAGFLSEARRVLRRGAWLVLYDDAFTGETRELPEFRRWLRDVFFTRYPSPQIARAPLTQRDAGRFGFRFAREEEYQHTERLTRDGFGDFLLSQANCLAAVDEGRTTAPELREWIAGQLRQLTGESADITCQFRGHIRYLQRRS